MKKILTSLIFLGFFSSSLVAQSSIKATLESGSYQIQRDGKRILRPKKTMTLMEGDFIILQKKASLTLALKGGAKATFGGSSVLLINPWEGEEAGLVSLIYGQAKITTTDAEANINSSFGELNIEENSEAYLAISKDTAGIMVAQGEAEFNSSTGEDQDVELGEMAVFSDEIRHKQLDDDDFSPVESKLNSPAWSKSPVSLWPIKKLVQAGLIDLEIVTDLKQARKSLNLGLTKTKGFTPTKIESGEVIAGKKMDDGPVLFELNREDYKSRLIGDVMEIQITFEK